MLAGLLVGRPRGFVEIQRSKYDRRPVAERVRDFRELENAFPEPEIRDQAARCMDCGVPFCHQGCPLGNLIPTWNDLVLGGRWDEAAAALHATNNFPEVTGRVCPAPCESSCVLALETIPTGPASHRRAAPGAVTIKQIERQIADHALGLVDAPFDVGDSADPGGGKGDGGLEPAFRLSDEPLPAPVRSTIRTGRRVAVVGSGPAGLAAAQQLARRGHDVTVLEKDDRIGGLLRYGIPDFKLEKPILDRRLAQMRSEGVCFETSVHAGVDVTGAELRARYDAIVLCGGAIVPRDLDVPGRDARGIHFAMDFLRQQNRRVAGDVVPRDGEILATGKRVVILGGGDTGSDCVGTSHRQGATHVLSLEVMPRPPDDRGPGNPWPQWPLVFRTSSSHDEGGERAFAVLTKRVLAGRAGHVRALEAVRVERQNGRLVEIPGSTHEIACELVLLAMGFVGSPRAGLLEQLGVELDARNNVRSDGGRTSVPGIFAAGDMARGQSLVVWAISEGRRVAEGVDAWLTSG